MEVEVLKGVVSRPFEPNLNLSADEAVYTGSVIPLSGQAAVRLTTTRIEAEVIDRTGWHARAWRELPPGTIGEPSLVFRPTIPGKLARPKHYGTIVTQVGWNADEVLYFGYREHNGLGGNEATYRFQLGTLRVDGPALGSPVVGIRSIYRRGGFGAGGKIDDHFVVVRRLSADEADIESEFLAVTYDCIPDKLTQDAVWHTLNFLAGNTVQPLATEHLAENGEIVYTEHRIGVYSRDTRQRFFHYMFEGYGKLANGGFETLAVGIRKMLGKDFPIDIILYHLHMAAGEAADVEAQHLVLAIHTAIEAWARFSGTERWMEDKDWDKVQRDLRKPMKELQLFKDLSEELQGNVRSAMAHANDTTTACRQQHLFDSLGIDVSDDSNKRALKYRNELMHNGYFLRRWHNLTQDEQQERFDDVERLRRLTLLIIFKLVGYTGDFTNPVTFSKEHVDSTGVAFPDSLKSSDAVAIR